MGLKAPRIAPLPESEWTDEVRAVLPAQALDGGQHPLNIFTTLARNPKLLKRWMVFGAHVLSSSLPAREREIVILRTGWLCKCDYEFHQHTRIGLACGLTSDEIGRLARSAEGWTERDAALIRAADELHADQTIGEATWNTLRPAWSDAQLLDLVFTIGQYTLVCMALNAVGVQIEEA